MPSCPWTSSSSLAATIHHCNRMPVPGPGPCNGIHIHQHRNHTAAKTPFSLLAGPNGVLDYASNVLVPSEIMAFDFLELPLFFSCMILVLMASLSVQT